MSIDALHVVLRVRHLFVLYYTILYYIILYYTKTFSDLRR